MFESAEPDLILTQLEHSRLSGWLALHWGNPYFECPPLDFADFVRGVTLHDGHYGPLDNHPLTRLSADEWLAVARRGMAWQVADPVQDVVIKQHLLRLIRGASHPDKPSLIDRLLKHIQRRIDESDHRAEDFEFADRITAFCDAIAFSYGFKNRDRHVQAVQPYLNDRKLTDISYQITADSRIVVDPWPFSVAEFAMPVVHYRADGYPDVLVPHIELVYCQAG